MNPMELRIGDVMQISPEGHQAEGFFAGCLMIVTEPKSFGCQGFVAIPGERGTIPNRAYCRIPFDDMEPIGRAAWVSQE